MKAKAINANSNIKIIMKMQLPQTAEQRQALLCAMYGKTTFKEVVDYFVERCREYKEKEQQAKEVI